MSPIRLWPSRSRSLNDSRVKTVGEREEHTDKMRAADADLQQLADRRKAALKQIAAADRKYKNYVRSHA